MLVAAGAVPAADRMDAWATVTRGEAGMRFQGPGYDIHLGSEAVAEDLCVTAFQIKLTGAVGMVVLPFLSSKLAGASWQSPPLPREVPGTALALGGRAWASLLLPHDWQQPDGSLPAEQHRGSENNPNQGGLGHWRGCPHISKLFPGTVHFLEA